MAQIPSPPAPGKGPRGARCGGNRAFFWAVALAGLLSAGCGRGDTRPSGVLLLSIDSLRADHVGAYGYRSRTRPDRNTTPAIDRLVAEQGALFEHAVSTTSWTLPSHLALLTGLPNEVHGVRDLPDRLPPDRRLVTEAFQAAGWRTFGIWSGPNVHPWFGFDRGFEEYVDCSTSSVESPDKLFGLEAEGGWGDVRSVHDASHRGVTGPAIVAAFERFAQSLRTGDRFFCFVHLWDVHYDYEPPPEFDVFFPGYEGPIDGLGFQGLLARGPLAERDLLRLISLYDAEILYTDHNIERMLGKLAALGRLDDTLVVITSDHGEEFMERGFLGHKHTLYEEVLRIPLIFRLPGQIPAGTRHGGLVSLIDVAPTLADWCDLGGFAHTYGRSLRPVLEGRRRATVEPVPVELTVRPLDFHQRGVHLGDQKVIRFAPERAEVVFDLAADPKERSWIAPRDLAPDDPRVLAARAVWARVDAAAAGLQTVEAGALPENLRRDLEAAGYLGGDE